MNKYGEENINSFQCLVGVNPLLFSQLCIIMLRSQKIMIMECDLFSTRQIKRICPHKNQLTWLKKVQPSFIRKDGLIGQVTIGDKQQPICIPGNSTITIMGCTNWLPSKVTCLVEQAEHHNLLHGIVINQCMAMPKARTIPVIIINTNRYNVCIRQPLLAAKLFDAECDEIEYRASLH